MHPIKVPVMEHPKRSSGSKQGVAEMHRVYDLLPWNH